MKAQTDLGTLGRVLQAMKESGIVDIPETDEPFDVAFAIVLEMPKEELKEILFAITGEEKDYTDEEAVRTLENFFMSLGKNLSKFIKILRRDFDLQLNMATQKMTELIDQITQGTISETDLDFLSKMGSRDMQTN